MIKLTHNSNAGIVYRFLIRDRGQLGACPRPCLFLRLLFFIWEQVNYSLILYRNPRTAWNENIEDACDFSSISLNDRTRILLQSPSLTSVRVFENMEKDCPFLQATKLQTFALPI